MSTLGVALVLLAFAAIVLAAVFAWAAWQYFSLFRDEDFE